MLRQDTLFITNQKECTFMVVQSPDELPGKELPIDSLWPSNTKTSTSTPTNFSKKSSDTEEIIMSAIFLTYLIVLVILSKEILRVVPVIIKSMFSLKNHIKTEEKLGVSSQRNIIAAVSTLFFPLLLIITVKQSIMEIPGISPPIFFAACSIVILGLWFIRKILLTTTAWITKEKSAFAMVEKISYNHIILLASISFLIVIAIIVEPSITQQTRIKTLIITSLLVFILYLIRTFQIIRNHHFSILFYILYLCAVELLPIALIVNFILSFL